MGTITHATSRKRAKNHFQQVNGFTFEHLLFSRLYKHVRNFLPPSLLSRRWWQHVKISYNCQSTRRHIPDYCNLSIHHKRTSDLLRHMYTKLVEISRIQRVTNKPVSTVKCMLQVHQQYGMYFTILLRILYAYYRYHKITSSVRNICTLLHVYSYVSWTGLA